MAFNRVLLIEDSPVMAKLVCSALAGQELRVTVAEGGLEALRLWAEHPSDVVLQDLSLPDMDGFELASCLRRLPGGAAVPILALSGLMSEMDEARIASVGFCEVIIKPVDPLQLRQAVLAHLPGASTARDRFGTGRRILIVDDDAIQAKLADLCLARLGFETTIASAGAEGLSLAHEARPDVILADALMPGMDGFEFCALIRDDPSFSAIPLVLMTSSYVDAEDREYARAAGADQLVIKTARMLEVIEALRRSLSPGAVRGTRADVPVDSGPAWASKITAKLERQASINAGNAQRCSMLAAELAILSGISDALAVREAIEPALAAVLDACLDAGQFAVGALHLTSSGLEHQLRFGDWGGWVAADAQAVLERAEHALIALQGGPLSVSTASGLRHLSPLLERAGLSALIAVRVTHRNAFYGMLVMGAKGSAVHHVDRLAFLEAVGAQIAQALSLTRAFADKDASERKACEQAAVLRSVLDTVDEGVVVTDRDGASMFWNPAAAAILGADHVHVPVRDWSKRFGLAYKDTLTAVLPDDWPLVRALRGEVVQGLEPFVLGAPAAQAQYVSISARPLSDRGRPIGAVGVLRDVTQEKATQAQLLIADRLASIGMLAAGVAHEINNPLAAVMANLELAEDAVSAVSLAFPLSEQLSRGMDLDELSQMLQDARVAAGRVQRIMRDLRVLSRAEADSSEPVDIHEVLEGVLRMANHELLHRARVVRDFGSVPRVLANESRLSQVFLNLVMNAVQALPEGQGSAHEIRISTRSDAAGRVVVTVADTGPGIAPESMKRLFQPFFTTKAVGLGTGLGLSICQRLVTAVGGEISVDSAPGEGAAFHVVLLPAIPVEAALPATPTTIPPPAVTRRGRVLLIDDDSAVLGVLLRTLAKQYECTATSGATEALSRLVAGERFDLILCDLTMPMMSGMAFYTRLERLDPKQAHKLVFLTGGASNPLVQAFLAAIPNRSIEKPFKVSELKAAVRARLHDQRHLQSALS